MGSILSDKTADRLPGALDAIESLKMPKVRTSRRRVRSVGGGGSVREYVTITSVIDAANYIGDVYDRPGGEVVDTGASIQVLDAVSNEYEEGYSAFADKSTDSNGDDVYFIDGYLLG